MTTLDIDGIVIEVQKKRVKNMNIRVTAPRGEVKISAPLRSSDELIRRFAATHIAWIKKHQAPYQGKHYEQACEYLSGERHFLFGREFILRVQERIGRQLVMITDDTYIDMMVNYGATVQAREKLMKAFYMKAMRQMLDDVLPGCEALVGRSGSSYQLRWMRSRWGSCNPATEKITLNIELVKRPVVCIEYVIVHELVHLLEASHNHRFKRLMDGFMPQWREYKEALTRITQAADSCLS